jgi:hypothetical protein
LELSQPEIENPRKQIEEIPNKKEEKKVESDAAITISDNMSFSLTAKNSSFPQPSNAKDEKEGCPQPLDACVSSHSNASQLSFSPSCISSGSSPLPPVCESGNTTPLSTHPSHSQFLANTDSSLISHGPNPISTLSELTSLPFHTSSNNNGAVDKEALDKQSVNKQTLDNKQLMSEQVRNSSVGTCLFGSCDSDLPTVPNTDAPSPKPNSSSPTPFSFYAGSPLFRKSFGSSILGSENLKIGNNQNQNGIEGYTNINSYTMTTNNNPATINLQSLFSESKDFPQPSSNITSFTSTKLVLSSADSSEEKCSIQHQSSPISSSFFDTTKGNK